MIPPASPAPEAVPAIPEPPRAPHEHAQLQPESVIMSKPVIDRSVVTLSDPSKPATIEIDLLHGEVIVKGYEGKEIIVEARSDGKIITDKNQDHKTNERAKGMKLIKKANADLQIEEEKNVVSVNVESWKATVDLILQVPYSSSIKVDGQINGGTRIDNISGEIEIEVVNGHLLLNNITGPVVASTVNGNIEVYFKKVNPKKPMSFDSLNGDIDITLPADTRATLLMESQQGDIYSDFDITLGSHPKKTVEEKDEEGGGIHISVDEGSQAAINGGGVEIQIETFNGDILIRKSK